MFHSAGHESPGDAFLLKNSNQPGKLAEAHPMQARGMRLQFRPSLFPNCRHHYVNALVAGGVQNQQRELSIAGDEAVARRHTPRCGHLITPRVELSIKRTNSWISSESEISSRIFSRAWAVLSWEEVRRRKARLSF